MAASALAYDLAEDSWQEGILPLNERDGWETVPLIDDTDLEDKVVTLPYEYKARDYQKAIWREMFPQDPIAEAVNRAVMVWHRRAGKDKTTINLIMAKAMERVGTYLYLLPKQNQAKKVIWNGMDKEGFKFIDHIPRELIARKNATEMLVELVNGSIIQIGGADNYDTWMGTNPIGIVFSEYSIQDPYAWEYFRPILVENGGWAVFIYTPRGKNHGYFLYNNAKRLARRSETSWFCEKLSYKDTGVLTDQQVADEIDAGMSEQLAEQEFDCSFEAFNQGAIYGRQMRKAWSEGRIGFFPAVEGVPVHTVQDIGVGDSNAVWFFQVLKSEVRLVHYYENFGRNMGHYINYIRDWIKDNNLVQGDFWAPHDIKVREYASKADADADGMAQTRFEIAMQEYGVDFKRVPDIPLDDGLEAGRVMFRQIRIHEDLCQHGVACLSDYEYEYDENLKRFKEKPRHNWAAHGADAFRYLAVIIKEVMILSGHGGKKRPPPGLQIAGQPLKTWSPFDASD